MRNSAGIFSSRPAVPTGGIASVGPPQERSVKRGVTHDRQKAAIFRRRLLCVAHQVVILGRSYILKATLRHDPSIDLRQSLGPAERLLIFRQDLIDAGRMIG